METRHVVGAAAALALVLALAGVLWAEAREAPEPLVGFEATWTTEAADPFTGSGELEEGESAEYAVLVPEANLTRAEARLVWEDDSGQPDRFRVNVTTSEDRLHTNASRNGTVTVSVNGSQVPEASTVEATDRDEARERAVDRYTSTVGQGTWTIQVTLEDAPGQRPVPGSQVELDEDGSNDFQLQFDRWHYQVELATPGAGP